jgi:type IV pilus assembly protein PilO
MQMPAALEQLVESLKQHKLILGFAGVVVIAVGAFVLVHSPARARIAELESRRAALDRELAQARTAVADLVRFRKETVELEKRLETIAEKLPTQRELPPLYRRTYEAASKAGLAVALFQPREPRAQDYYTEIPITLTAEGSYHQLGKFFETTANFSRIVTVADMKMTGLNRTKAPLRAEVTLATYVYRPVGSPPVPKPGAKPGSTPPPAATPAPKAALPGRPA